MPPPDLIRLDPGLAPAAFWPALAAAAGQWMDRRQVAVRDAVLVLPFVELLAPARQAWAQRGGWQPRIETLQTLCQAQPPAADAEPLGVSGDLALDRLVAASLLADRAGLAHWRQQDPQAFDQSVDALVQAAQVLARGAAAHTPAERHGWWDRARQALPVATAGSARSALLSQLALEWAALAGPPATDRLLALRPSAWLMLQAGGDEAQGNMLLAQAAAAGVPGLVLAAEAAPDAIFDSPLPEAPRLWGCADAEAEALAAAAAVIDAVAQGQAPVALIAEDRLQVRRVRALLERAGVLLADESGWTLDTTRAGARLMAWLRAAHPSAGADAWLDWLKGEFASLSGASAPPPAPALAPGDAPHQLRGQAPVQVGWVDRLERLWRRGPPRKTVAATDAPAEAVAAAGPPQALQRWAEVQTLLQPLQRPARRPLLAWLQALRDALLASPDAAWWQRDEAGRLVWQALRLGGGGARDDVDGLPLSLDEFTRWADGVLAEASFRPAAPQAQVVITPMARAMLRPFGAVVLPGADARHLGPASPGPGLLSDGLLRELGLPDSAARSLRLARSFMLLLRQPGTVLLRRHADGDGPVAASPWVARLNLARLRQGLAPVQEQPAPVHLQAVPAQPVCPPAPVARGALPDTVSASAVEALRACPYRFFARSVLRLAEDEELDADPGKREYGTVLHNALFHFHEDRRDRGDLDCGPEAEQALVAHAEAAAQAEGLAPAAMLPFMATMPAFAQRYLAWLAGREAQGWFYLAGELDGELPLDGGAAPALAAEGAGPADPVDPAHLGHPADPARPGGLRLRLRGRIDRLDQRLTAAGPVWQLIDYKTGALTALRTKTRQPLEDTQLAFYAAQLLGGGVPSHPVPDADRLSAAYVALDEREVVAEAPHEGVAHSAQALIDGLAVEWPRLVAGEPLRPLGQGQVCSHCEVRGLCRRDHWWPLPVAGGPADGPGLAEVPTTAGQGDDPSGAAA